MGTKSHAENDRLGNHMGAENGENHYGAHFMGQRTRGLAVGAKAKGSGTGREQRRHALWGESLWGRHNWAMREGVGS